jgi:hypothetical protein
MAPRLWDDGYSANVLDPMLRRALGSAPPDALPLQCPACEAPSVHTYFHGHGPSSGGAWIWCSNCGRFLHERVRPPDWWFELDDIDEEQLTAIPEYLDAMATRIDAHWNRLRQGR